MSEAANTQMAWNQTRRRYSHSRGIAGLFAARAAKCGKATALQQGKESLSYRKLNQRANQLAHYLKDSGITPESLVGICLERSVQMVVSLLGVLKAGAAYVPLDSSYPRERLEYMLEDSGVRVVLTEQRMLDLLPQRPDIQFVCIDRESEAISQASKRSLVSNATGRSLAYVMYTSGSTGKPKGVAVEQQSVVRLVRNANYVKLGPDEVMLQFAPISFDAATFEIWGALLNGGKLVIAPAQLPSLEELGKIIRENRVTTLWLTASLFHAMVQERLNDLCGVHQLLAGGDVLFPHHVYRAATALRNGVVINGYGPTENTTFTCCFIARDLNQIGATVPIGKPITNTQAYILDEDFQPVSVGVAGELYAGGDGLARGYWNRPDLTAGKFVPDPVSGNPGARLYRTGDRARWLPDGNIEFLGRLDDQVKIRGFRIELAEVELALHEQPEVEVATVTVYESQSGEKRLVAHVVPRDRAFRNSAGLRNQLAEKLPEYMLPSQFVFLEQLPMTAVGKIDRSALTVPETTATEVLPQTEIERILALVCASVLGLPSVSLAATFFELGGSSLSAIQVIASLRESFALDLGIAELLSGQTLQEMSRSVGPFTGPPARSAFKKISRENTLLPAAFSQERVWFVNHVDRDNLAYHFHAKVVFLGKLDVQALERALEKIVERHEIYRTTYVENDGQLFQIINPPWPVRLDVIDLQEQSTTEEEVFQKEAQQFFDLTKLPLARWRLLRHAPPEHTLLVTEHHVVHDGWSFNVFLKELTELYRAGVEDYIPRIAAQPLQFADYAYWQREWMQSPEAQAQLDFWTRTLADAPALLSLPWDHPRPAVPSHKGAAPRTSISDDLDGRLLSVAQQNRITLFGVYMAAFQILLFRYSGQHDFCVGTAVANRRWAETTDLIGMLVNNLVLRTRIASHFTIAEVIENLNRTLLSTYANQDVPFDKVVQVLHPARDLSYNPLFQATLSFHDSPIECASLPGMSLRVDLGLSNSSAKFDLNVIMLPAQRHNLPSGEKRLRTLIWEYSTDLFEPETVQRMMSHYLRVLEAVATDGQQAISEIPLLDDKEWQQIIVEWNQTQTPFPADQCVHQLFEQQVEKMPSATAVASADRSLTYLELNRKANQLAHYLRKLDVGPEIPVGICMDRSLDQVVATMAVLKAGGAYVPLDVTYPGRRLQCMIQDSQVKLVLTQSHVRSVLGDTQIREILVDRDWEEIVRENHENLQNIASPENLAYIIYTSGSTGAPKGVAVAHCGIANLACWYRDFNGVTPLDRMAHVAAWAFDASVFELWPCLLNGACLELPAREILESLPRLLQWFAERGITITFLPTPLASMLPTMSFPEGLQLRKLMTGGDRLPAGDWSGLPFPLINNYGPTENTVATTCAPAHTGATPLIGKPIANVRVYVLDENFHPVPIGAAGEMLVGGKGLARGYLGRPDLTAENFVPDPFSGEPGERLYRTGDIARYRLDGSLEFIGRRDHQVKLRGYRIELGEIEAALLEHFSVEQARVVLHEAENREKHLVAYLVPSQACATADTAALRAFLQERLPAYMAPATYVVLKELPLTPNGKIDHKALPSPERSSPAHRDPRNQLEETLCGIFAEVLSLKRVSIDDDFFVLGGHSLMAMRVISRVRAALGAELTVRTIFEAPTIAQLSTRLAAVTPPKFEPVLTYAKPSAVKRI